MHPHEQEERDAWFNTADRFDGFDRGDLDNPHAYDYGEPVMPDFTLQQIEEARIALDRIGISPLVVYADSLARSCVEAVQMENREDPSRLYTMREQFDHFQYAMLDDSRDEANDIINEVWNCLIVRGEVADDSEQGCPHDPK